MKYITIIKCKVMSSLASHFMSRRKTLVKNRAISTKMSREFRGKNVKATIVYIRSKPCYEIVMDIFVARASHEIATK